MSAKPITTNKPQSIPISILHNISSGTPWPGEISIYQSSRRSGKSMFYMSPTRVQPSLTLGEGKVHGATYYTVIPAFYDWLEIEKWATNIYGEPASIWNAKCGRWYMNNQKFWFRNEADLTLFILKWS